MLSLIVRIGRFGTYVFNITSHATGAGKPCVSIGNVPQLAADLIINTLQLSRAGYLHHPGLLPLVGNDAFDHLKSPGHLHLSTEGIP